MIYARKRTRHVCGWTYTELAVCYDRRATHPTSLRKAITTALLVIVLTVTFFAAMEITDIPDHKPTAQLLP